MHIQLVSDLQEFARLRAEWNDLLSRSLADTIFLTWEWLFSWWQSYAAPNDTLHIMLVRDSDNELIGLLPLYQRCEMWLHLNPIKKLCFIGDGSWDSDYLDGILVEGREEEILDSVWEWLNRRKSTWDLLQLNGIPETSATTRWLRKIAGQKQTVSTERAVPCLVADLPHSWEVYLASLKPRFRTKIRSSLREIAASHQVRLYAVQAEAELDAALESLYRLHLERWESKGTKGVFQNPAKRRFYELFSHLFVARGWLAFQFLELNGVPVACQMCFNYRDTQFLLQEGFDPRFASESVGVVLRAMVLQKAIEKGIRKYDFLAGVGRHKAQWQTRLKYCRTMSFGPKTIQNTMYLRFPVVLDRLRGYARSLLPAKVLEIRRNVRAG